MANFKYILANKDNPRGLKEQELYNLVVDKLEKTDLSETDAEYCTVNNKERRDRLQKILGELLKEAQSTAVRGDGAELDEATIERMKALGYME